MARLTRVPGWEAAFAVWAASRIGAPFAWGETDCVSLTREGLAVIFGTVLVPELSGWHTEREALAAWRALPDGVRGVLRGLGATPLDRHFATRGDLGLVPLPDRPPYVMLVVPSAHLLVTRPGEVVTALSIARYPLPWTAWRFPDE